MKIKRLFILIAVFLSLLNVPVNAAVTDSTGYDIEGQLDALGRDELMRNVPEDARELMEETGIYEMNVSNMLQLSPKDFFKALWDAFLLKLKTPARTLGAMAGILLLCAFMNGLKNASWDSEMTGLFGTVSVLCVVVSMAVPILGCVTKTMKSIKDASYFMMSFIPAFSASLVAAGQPAAGATYNMFLFTACQAISQVVSQTLMPLMGIYLALCIAGAAAPEINIASAAGTVKSVVTWALGLMVTLFVGLFSVQSMVGAGTDTAATKAVKYMLGSFVPVVGSALSDAYSAAQGCLKLIKTSVGAYGIIVAVFTLLPTLLDVMIWYAVTSVGVIAGDIIGVKEVSSVLKSCAGVLGMLIAVILCYALLLIASTAVILVTGTGVGA